MKRPRNRNSQKRRLQQMLQDNPSPMIPQPPSVEQPHKRHAEESREDHHSVAQRESERIFRDEFTEFQTQY